MVIADQQYITWLRDIKSNIQRSQIKASVAVNTELIKMYWFLGKEIFEKQENSVWGSGFIDQLSKDLKLEFPEMSGFSPKNLRYCKTFYEFWQQAVAKLQLNENQLHIFNIPWGHNIILLQKIKNESHAHFYVEKTIEKPIGVSQYLHISELPDNLKTNIPSRKEWGIILDKTN